MKKEMIDYHCHLLPALDDGASDLYESLEIGRILSDFGFTTVHCTPHRIRGWYENEPRRVLRATHIMQGLLEEAGIGLKLIASTEHYFDEFLPDALPDALRAGNPKLVLVEVPFGGGTELLPPLVACFSRHGLTPLIAHPERCRAFVPEEREHGWRGAFSSVLGKPKPAADLQDSQVTLLRQAGCRFQGNLGSFAGYYGRTVRERALLFLKNGVYSCLGSDAHRSDHLRETLNLGLEAVVETVGEEGAIQLLSGSALNL